MRLRKPRPDELAALSDLCLRSKAVWGYEAGMIEAFRKELTLSQGDLDTDYLVLAEDLRGLAGLVQVSVEGRAATLEKLFVEPERLGEGTGKMLYVWACRTAQGLGAAELLIDADPDAEAFYLHQGAVRIGTGKSLSIPGRLLPRLVHSL